MATAVKKNQPTEETQVREAVEQANTIIVGLFKYTVNTYWQLGKLVNNLDTSYGKGAVKTFSTELTAKLGEHNEISISTLYRCSQFYKKYSEDKKDRMIEAGVSWSQVVQTLPEDPVIVNEAIDRVIDNDVDISKLGDTVKTMRETDGNPSESKKRQEKDTQAEVAADLPSDDKLGSPRDFKKETLKIEGTISSLLDQTGTLFILIDKYKQMDAEAKKAVKKELGSVFTALTNIREPIGTIYNSLKELDL